jgi:hypothetical protein
MMSFDKIKSMQEELLQMHFFRKLVIAILVAKEQLNYTKCMYE